MECQLQQRDVELGVVGEHTDRGTGIHGRLCQVAVGPVDDDLVGVREACPGGEDGAGVAHGDVIAQEPAGLGEGGAEVEAPKISMRGRVAAAWTRTESFSGQVSASPPNARSAVRPARSWAAARSASAR